MKAPIEHAGVNVIELEIAPVEGELATDGDRAVVNIDGVRDKLRVLLVSGKPHPGERMWRNLLKSDANVDLVHFTILRPPEKSGDAVPINELSLIAFPVADLFGQKIKDFDLIIFDRYAQQSILPYAYLDNIVNYVRNGGALLMAEGPEYSAPDGLFYSPLGAIAPASPTSEDVETPFRAQIPELGLRHPVTRGLIGPDAGENPPAWGRWFRLVGATATDGQTVMTGPDGKPLLILSRVDKGRVGLLLTDQMWLWARGYDGGGPYLDLLRRLAHWLMKEPELEEEALRASARGRTITVERQSVSGEPRDTVLTGPGGVKTKLDLAPVAPGLSRAQTTVDRFGLYRADDGAHVALVNVGPENPLEMRDVVSTPEKLRPLAEATGGSVRRLSTGSGRRRKRPAHRRAQPRAELRRRRLYRRQADRFERTDRRALDVARLRLLRAGAAARRRGRGLALRGRAVRPPTDINPTDGGLKRDVRTVGSPVFCWRTDACRRMIMRILPIRSFGFRRVPRLSRLARVTGLRSGNSTTSRSSPPIASI